MALAPPDLDPEVALLLARLVDERLVASTGAGSARRSGQAIAVDAYALGWQHAEAMAVSGHGRSVLTVVEYAARAGVSERTVRRLARAGRIPARRAPGGWHIEIESTR